MKPVADVAVIVPVLDDLPALERLVEQIDALSSAPAEIIVVGGTLDPALEAYCGKRSFHYGQTHACRGAQLDQGARMAKASILWFVHADAEIAATALEDVASVIDHGADGGCFRFALQGPPSPVKRVIEQGVALRIACGGMAYGDQGIFCSRRAYAATPGFTDDPLFEEVALIKALRRRPLRFHVLKTPIHASTRRFEQDGWLHRSLHNRWLALCYACGASPSTLAERYRRSGTRLGGTRA